ncbi:MAG: sulfurtransferase TusA family protein [Bacillota bacterium]
MAEKYLNLVGEFCPLPLVKTREAVEKMSAGDVLLVKTDLSQGVRNIIKWCDNQGHDFDLDEVENGLWQITITKKVVGR